jgi:hypothetical protein
MTAQKVRIVRVTDGVAYADDKDNNRLAAFSFGKIKGYRGQTAKELGLRPGREVTLEYDAEDKVDSVLIAS